MIIADAKEFKQALAAITKREGKNANTTPWLQVSVEGSTCTLRLSDSEWHDVAVTIDVQRDARLKRREMILPTEFVRTALKSVRKRGLEFCLSEKVAGSTRPLCVGDLECLPHTENIPKPSEWEGVSTDSAPVWFTIPAGDLRELLADVSIAVSTDDTRPILTAVYLAVKRNTLTAVATGTYRLVTGEAKVMVDKRLTGYALLPTPTLRNVEKALSAVPEDEVVTVSAVRPEKGSEHAKALSFVIGNRQVRGLCAAGEYVSYKRVIPEDGGEYQWLVNVDEVRAALTSLEPIAEQDANRVVGHLQDGTWHLSAMAYGDAGVVVAESTIPIAAAVMASKKPDLAHGFNGQYLLEYLDRLGSGNVTIETNGPLHALRCQGQNDSMYVLMPMQVM